MRAKIILKLLATTARGQGMNQTALVSHGTKFCQLPPECGGTWGNDTCLRRRVLQRKLPKVTKGHKGHSVWGKREKIHTLVGSERQVDNSYGMLCKISSCNNKKKLRAANMCWVLIACIVKGERFLRSEEKPEYTCIVMSELTMLPHFIFRNILKR